ncbi:MAG TPA: hypothetical protein QF564_01960 [Pirellulaceae bacterium]|nr:hypothetical protein [Pirellulaceae bacterium]
MMIRTPALARGIVLAVFATSILLVPAALVLSVEPSASRSPRQRLIVNLAADALVIRQMSRLASFSSWYRWTP